MGDKWYYEMDADGETPMSRALKSGHLALTELMLRQRDDDAPVASPDGSLLQRAAYWGLDNAMRKLLAGGADPSERDRQGETPLHKAVRRGHRQAVETLIGNGANVNAVSDHGLTSLHWVALTGRSNLARILIERGADVNVREDFAGGLTPLAMAKLMGYEEVADVIGQNGGTW